MTNLLPLESQKKNRQQMRARFILVASLFAIGAACVAFLALIPSYLTIRSGVEPAPLTSAASAQSATDKKQVAETTFLASTLQSFVVSSTTATQAISIALAVKPTGISIDNISYTSDRTTNTGQLVFSGTSQSADVISGYRDALAKDPHFLSVTVPVSALIGSKDGRFTMTVEGNF